MKKACGCSLFAALLLGSVAACAVEESKPFDISVRADLDEPWAMTFLLDGRLLVTEKRGALKLVDAGGEVRDINGVPEVAYGGQGGLGDVVLHPRFADSSLVYLSYAEEGEGGAGATVARARLLLTQQGGSLEDVEVIWRQVPKVSGKGHYAHRMAFGPQGYLWISSGERQKFDPAQDMASNLGKVLRLNDDGSLPPDNPFAGDNPVTSQIWSFGHRNPLGLAFDSAGQLWDVEMGPAGGDELNLVKRGENYGYPVVSEGDHYDGRPIPDHATRPEFEAPRVVWNPVISPSSLMFYSGSEFPQWQGSAFIGGLSSEALVRIEFDGQPAREAERFSMGARIRDVEQGPDGAIWLLEDGGRGSGGRLLRLTPLQDEGEQVGYPGHPRRN
ncbi:MAG: PQQ-dependent sugar dehydrogenase [Parahaliea sp.]